MIQSRLHNAGVAATCEALLYSPDPTIVICYLIWPCDIAVPITHLISHGSSLSYNTVIKGYFRLGV